MSRRTSLLTALMGAVFALCACTDEAPLAADDAGAPDAPPADVSTGDVALSDVACSTNQDCDDGVYCNGAERCVGGLCAPGVDPCDDRYSCTRDVCDEAGRRCARVPDDSMCGDTNACNGVERCDPTSPGALPGTGCQPVRADNLVDCDDRNTCTLDACDERLGCVHSPRDLDGDGYVASSCTLDGTPSGPPGNDCNDSDPRVFPGSPEVCDDGRDNNCNNLTDFADTMACRPSNDACARAQAISLPASGTVTVVGSTSGITGTTALSCATTMGRATALYRFTLAAPQDIALTDDDAVTGTSQGAIALLTSCDPAAELRCARGVTGSPAAAPSLQLRSLAAGTYYVAVQTSTARIFRLRVTVGRATTPPENDLCPAAGAALPNDLSDGMTRTVSFGGLLPDHTLSCDTGAPGPDAVFPLVLTGTRNVTITAVPRSGDRVTLALSRAPCGALPSELRCVTGTTQQRVIQRELAAGTYYVIVRSGSGQDVELQAMVTDPAMRPAGDGCPGVVATPDGPALELMPSTYERYPDVGTSCGSRGSTDGWTDWVVRFTLGSTRDVSVTLSGSGTSSLRMQLQTGCGSGMTGGELVGPCLSGSPPARRYRNLTAGTYYLVIESTAPPAGLSVSVTTTDPGTRLTGDTCPGVAVTPDGAPTMLVPAAFDVTSDYGTACGSRGPTDNWTDWVFSFRLTERRDVTVSMLGGGSTTRMQLQSSCGPMAEPIGGCVTGSSLLERRYRSLEPGTYYIVGESSGSVPPTGPIRAIVSTTAPATRPAGEQCGNAVTVVPDGFAVPIALSSFDLTPDEGTRCGSATTTTGNWIDFVSTFTLTTQRDVTVTMSAPTTIYGELRSPCSDRASTIGACSAASSTWTRRYARLGPGTYSVVGEVRSVPTGGAVNVQVTTAAPGSIPSYTMAAAPSDVTFVDVCGEASSTRLLDGAIAATATYAMPFSFQFWGLPVPSGSSLTVASKGFLTFVVGTLATSSGLLPSTSTPNGVIAPFWTDLRTRTPGVCVATLGSAPNRRVVVQWNDANYFSGAEGHLTFEAVLHEGTNIIDFVYRALNDVSARTPAVGLERQDGFDAVALCPGGVAGCAVTSTSRLRFTPTP